MKLIPFYRFAANRPDVSFRLSDGRLLYKFDKTAMYIK